MLHILDFDTNTPVKMTFGRGLVMTGESIGTLKEYYGSSGGIFIASNNPITELISVADTSAYDSIDTYLDIVVQRALEHGRLLGIIDEGTSTPPSSMNFVSENSHDLLLSMDDYVYIDRNNWEQYTPLRCMAHDYTYITLRMPTGDWGDKDSVSVWTLSLRTLFSMWFLYKKEMLGNDKEIDTGKFVLQYVFSPTITDIADIAMLNREGVRIRKQKYDVDEFEHPKKVINELE